MQPMDDPPKKRRFWQFHLSTLLLMVILAGTFVTLNMPRNWVELGGSGSTSRYCVYSYSNVGWPFNVKYLKHDFSNEKRDVWTEFEVDNPSSLIWNAGMGLVFVALSGVISESLIRRREGRKQPELPDAR